MKAQKGFTLIELIMVIVILGILAATALPKFTDLRGEAETGALQGVVAAINSACAFNYAQRQISPGVSSIGSITAALSAVNFQGGTVPAESKFNFTAGDPCSVKLN